MKIIGLTGPSGSGKGTVACLLGKRGIPTVDTDAVYHDLLIPPSPCLDELRRVFGEHIIKDGRLDRPTLANIVFSDKDKLTQLNSVTHKYILQKTNECLNNYIDQGFDAATVDAPALYESGFDQKCDFVIAVTAPREARVERVIDRDRLDRAAAEHRIDAQKPEQYYTERAKYTVCNDSDTERLIAELDRILHAEKLGAS